MKMILIAFVALAALILMSGCTQNNSAPVNQAAQAPANTVAPAPVAPALGGNTTTGGNTAAGTNTTTAPKSVTIAEVGKHSTKENCWMVVDGIAYDVTGLDATHPNGQKLLAMCGQDASVAFDERAGNGPHPKFAKDKLAKMEVGIVSG